jgi:glycosyltransferase involved in cell wall biosynthesis
VWVLKDGEILPIDAQPRRMRTWMLADALVARGHRVTWWASTFAHQRKALASAADRTVDLGNGFELRLLHAGTYRGNVSVKRYLHHWRLGRRFAAAAVTLAPPDVIVTAFPVIDLAYAAVQYARARGIPVVVDVRDLWPDTFLERVPGPLKPLGRLALWRDFQQTEDTLAAADSLVAMSEGVLRWARDKGHRSSPADRVFPIGHAGVTATAAERPAYLGPPGELVVAYVGAFGSAYDLRTVIAAARRLWIAGRRDVRFVLAGDGEQAAAIKAAGGDLPNVVFPGWLGPADSAALLAHADVAVLPWQSIPDAMPNKFFDYLSAGLPVISSAAGELAGLLDETHAGWFYPSGDAAALERLVVTLGDHRQRLDAAAAAARTLFVNRFQAAEIYAAYAAHVESIAAGRLRPAA